LGELLHCGNKTKEKNKSHATAIMAVLGFFANFAIFSGIIVKSCHV
jgi:hypothetical protein